ncbi:MAG: TonB-dependent receptor [Proteobacteria bacterium]|nr:TonB-dependent receptor [Pseudomonadota bacterium]MCP4918498.1 TonB-dependent receptor [Pseudomonadota bacterium]
MAVVVTGTRTSRPLGESPVNVELIDREEIESSGAESLDELLEHEAGLDIERTFRGSHLQLQGLEPDHTLILVDGQRVVGREGGAIDLSRYPLESVERIEIVKGAGSVLYGSDAMGGVVNIITRRPDEDLAADARLAAGTQRTADLSAGLSAGRGRVGNRLDVGVHTSDGYDLDPSDIATNGSAFRVLDVSDQIQVQLSPDWVVRARGGYMIRDAQGVNLSNTGAEFDQRDLTEEVQTRLAAEGWLTPQTMLSLSAYATWFRNQYVSDQRGSYELDSYQDTRERLVQASTQLDQGLASHTASLGVDALSEWMDSDRLGKAQGERARVAFFAQDEWAGELVVPLGFVAGARVDMDNQFGTHPTARLAVRVQPVEPLVLKANGGLGYRAPSFKEMLLYFENPGAGYRVEGNPDLRPETSSSLGVTVELSPVEPVFFSLHAFRNDLDDLITVGTAQEAEAGSPTVFSYVNVAEAVTQGVEAQARFELDAGVRVGASYTFTDAQDLEQSRLLEGRARHRGSAQLGWSFEPWATDLQVRAGRVGPRAFYPDGELELGLPYTSLDARLAREFFGQVSVFVEGDNLLGAGDTTWNPIPPRGLSLGLSGHFVRARAAQGEAP